MNRNLTREGWLLVYRKHYIIRSETSVSYKKGDE